MDFEYPLAKRVRRSELTSHSPSPASSPSTDIESDPIHVEQLEKIYSIVPPSKEDESHQQQTNPEQVEHSTGPETYTFRLFSSGRSKDVVQSQNILLRSPSPQNKEPGLLQPQQRPLSHYLTAHDPLEARRRNEYMVSAMETEYISREAQHRWPGAHLPWRVTTMPVSTLQPRLRDSTVEHQPRSSSVEGVRKRRRTGKKRRIVIRMRFAREREKAARKEEEQKAHEVKWEEKRKSENRKKKLRKREKDKAKKAAQNDRASIG